MRNCLCAMVVLLIVASILGMAPMVDAQVGDSSTAMSARPWSVPENGKAEFYKRTEFKKSKELPRGFSIQDYFTYSGKNEFHLGSSPPIAIKKGDGQSSFENDRFQTGSFRFKVGRASISEVSAGTQVLKDVPAGSTVVWDGNNLKLILPEKKPGEAPNPVKEVVLIGKNTVSVSQKDGKTLLNGDFSGGIKVGDAVVTGKGVSVNVEDGKITGNKGTKVHSPQVGSFEFLKDGTTLSLSGKKADFSGEFRLDTRENRKVQVSGKGSYDASSQVFEFKANGNGKVTDLELGIHGEQSDQNKLFFVGLKPDQKFEGKNGVVLSSKETRLGERVQIDRNKLYDEIFGLQSKIPDKLKAVLKQSIREGKDPKELLKQLSLLDKGLLANSMVKADLGSLIAGKLLTDPDNAFTLDNNIESVVKLFNPKNPHGIKVRLGRGETPIQIYQSLGESEKRGFQKVFPDSLSQLTDVLTRYSQSSTTENKPTAFISAFGDAKFAYAKESFSPADPFQKMDQWVFSESKGGAVSMQISPGMQRSLMPLEIKGQAGNPVMVSGTGVKNKVDPISIPSGTFSSPGPSPPAERPPAERERAQNSEARKNLALTPAETLLKLRTQRAFAGDTKAFEEYKALIEKTHPGVKIDSKTGEVTFPERKPLEAPQEVINNKERGRLMAELYLSSPRFAKDIDDVATKAQAALRDPSKVLMSDTLSYSRQMDRLTGGHGRDVAEAMWSNEVGIEGIRQKIAVGIPLDQSEITSVRQLQQVLALNPSLASIASGGSGGGLPGLTPGLLEFLKSIPPESLSLPNPLGLANQAETLKKWGISGQSLPPSMTLLDGVAAGIIANAKPQSSSAVGLIALSHLGADKGQTIVVRSMDGVGAVAATLTLNGMVYRDIPAADMGKYDKFDSITIDIPKAVSTVQGPEKGMLQRISTIPSIELRNSLLTSMLAKAGNNPYQPTMDLMKLYEMGGLEISGIQAQGLRMFFGGKNEIDATKVLIPQNLMALAQKHNYNVEAVLKEVHRVTDRRGIDPLVRKFVEGLKKK